MNKKLSFSVLLLLMAICMHAADFTAVSLAKNGGGEISGVNHVIRSGDALYAATSDGVWTSPSGVGGDWDAYGSGLSGAVSLLNFDNKELAIAADGKLYSSASGVWTELTLPGTPTVANITNFTQVGDVIMIPSGNTDGFYRSTNGGTDFEKISFGTKIAYSITKLADDANYYSLKFRTSSYLFE